MCCDLLGYYAGVTPTSMTSLLQLAGTLALLLVIAVLVLRLAGVPRRWEAPVAVLRGGLQLLVLSLILGEVITSGWWVAVALLVMFTVAAVTSARRLHFSWARLTQIGLAMMAGVLVAVCVVFATGALEFSSRYALALGGIVVGNSMSIATLTARRLYIDLHDRWDVVEGWLALGASPRQSNMGIARQAAGEALVPTVDQTRTVGLVTLPGSFVGAIFGGASPADAGRFQIVVLTAVITAGAITAVLLIQWLGKVKQKPAPLS